MTELRTFRFRLVAPTADDVPALAAHWRHPEVRRFLWDDQVVATDVVEAVVATSIDDHARRGWGGWVVRTDDARSELVGWCGLHLGPPDGSAASELLVELLYSLDPRWWRTGAVVEAATAVLDHVFTTSDLDEVFAGVDRPNQRSAATLARLGFTPARELLLDVGLTPYWRMHRVEWLDRRPPLRHHHHRRWLDERAKTAEGAARRPPHPPSAVNRGS